MKKEDVILKINKLGNVSDVIITICKILLIIAMVVSAIGMVVMLILPKQLVKMDMSANTDVSIDFSALGLELNEEDRAVLTAGIHDGLNDEEYGKSLDMTMDVNGTKYEAEEIVVDDTTISIKATVDTYTIELRDLWIICLLGVITIAALFVTLVFAGRLCKAFRDCQSPFEENIVKNLNCIAYSLFPWVIMTSITDSITESIFTNNYQFALGVDLGVLMVIFLIFVLAYIFKYGAVLQQESDETL